MKLKVLLIASLVIFFVVAGYIYCFHYSNAQSVAAPADKTEGCSDVCYKQVMEKLDKVLANQSDIIYRLKDLDRLVKTRQVN